jgi:drug/metabolite transporter (DMT)-like permease
MWTSELRSYSDLGLFVGLAAVWGTAYLAIQVGLQSIPPVTLAALRYDAAGLLLLGATAVIALRRGGRWRPRTTEEWKLVGVGGLLVIGVHFALLFAGQRYVSGGVASVVMSLNPVLTPVFALALLPDERPDARGVVGVSLGLVGVAIVARPDPSGGRTAIGVGLLFLSAASFALGSVLTRRYESDLSLVSAQAWTMLIGAVVLDLLVVVLPGESFGAAEVTPAALAALAYLSIIASIGGFVAYFRLLDRFGPERGDAGQLRGPDVRRAERVAGPRDRGVGDDRRRVRGHPLRVRHGQIAGDSAGRDADPRQARGGVPDLGQ